VNEEAMLDELLGPLHMHFRAARAAYRDYLENGQTFLFASSLRRINLDVRALLLRKGYLLCDDLQAAAVALVGHYDVWLTLWDDLAVRQRPGPGDRFAFANRHTYPKEAEDRLESRYQELRAKL
jgi:hypothetical protein